MVAAKVGIMLGCAGLSAGAGYLIASNINLNPDAQLVMTVDKTTIAAGEQATITVTANPGKGVICWVASRVDNGSWTKDAENGSLPLPATFKVGPPIDPFAEHDIEYVAYTPQKISQTTATPGPYYVSNSVIVHFGKSPQIKGDFALAVAPSTGLTHKGAGQEVTVTVTPSDTSSKGLNFGLCLDPSGVPIFSIDVQNGAPVMKRITGVVGTPLVVKDIDLIAAIPPTAPSIYAAIFSKEGNQVHRSPSVKLTLADDLDYTMTTTITKLTSGGSITVAARTAGSPGVVYGLFDQDGRLTDSNKVPFAGIVGQPLTFTGTEFANVLAGNRAFFAIVYDAGSTQAWKTNTVIVSK